MRFWLLFLAIPVALYVGAAFLMWSLQSRLVFFPDPNLLTDPAAHDLPFEDVWLNTDDGERIHGWFVAASEDAPVVLFLHGNAGNVSHRINTLEMFKRLDMSVLIIDYRGYGRSSGKADEQGSYNDALAAWQHLIQERGISPQRIIIFGRSLGGGVASWLASQEKAGALVLESTFRSIPAIAADHYRWLPVRLLARIHYDTEAWLENIESPTMILHSKDDEIINFEHGQTLYRQVVNPVEFVTLIGDHNNGYELSGKLYTDAWRRMRQRIIDINDSKQ